MPILKSYKIVEGHTFCFRRKGGGIGWVNSAPANRTGNGTS